MSKETKFQVGEKVGSNHSSIILTVVVNEPDTGDGIVVRSERGLYHVYYEKDLRKLPKTFKYERWVNVYSVDQIGELYRTREEAEDCNFGSVATVKIIIEGEEDDES